MNYELVQNAEVAVARGMHNGKPYASVDVNDYHVDFPVGTSVSTFLQYNEPQTLQEQMTGGKFFFVDGELTDFRYGDYKGFVHDEATIEALMRVIGATRTRRSMTRRIESQDTVFLERQWSSGEVDVPRLNTGGKFNTSIVFGWSPFQQHISTVFNILRLICANGVVAQTPILNRKVPVINRWEQHLNIASVQLIDRVRSFMIDRIDHMVDDRATVSQCALMHKHVVERAKHAETPHDKATLGSLASLLSPSENLVGFYRSDAILDKNISSRLPAHLTEFDLYNIATQVRSHQHDTPRSTSLALDMLATSLMFKPRRDDTAAVVIPGGTATLSYFSDPEQAFFGVAPV